MEKEKLAMPYIIHASEMYLLNSRSIDLFVYY